MAATTTSVAKPARATTITIPTLSSIFAPARTTTTAPNTVSHGQCMCCNQTSTTVCLTFDTTLLQSLVNMIPKINITNSSSSGCSDPNCGCDDDEGQEETGQ
jgi:hypothetical protein